MNKEEFKKHVYANLVKFEDQYEIKRLGLEEKEGRLVDYLVDFLKKGDVPSGEEQVKAMFAAIEAGRVYEPPRVPFEFDEKGAQKVAEDVAAFLKDEAESRFFENLPKAEAEALCVAAKALEMSCLPNNEIGIKLIGNKIYGWQDLVYLYNAHHSTAEKIKVYREHP